MAKSKSRKRNTASLVQSPQLCEELWMKISQHLTFKEWAKAAGACAAAWGAQCICSVDITEELCVAGWQFLFKRCAQSTALQIRLTPENAEIILKALSGKAPLPDLGCVEDMRVTIQNTVDDSENATVLVAFNTLALICKNTQIAELTCHETIALPPFAALKHLILSLASLADVPITTLQNAVALETLSLGIYGEYADWSLNVIDMSHLPALKHMRIENFAPQELHVPDGCLLHIVWDEDHTDGSKFVQWVQVQSLWQAQRNRLGSLQVYLKPGGPQTDKMAALKGLLTGDQELAYISLWIPELGYEHKPFQVDSNSCQMLALAERVAFWSEKVCSISIADMQPKWKLLSLRAARVNLEIEDLAALVHSLDNFWIEGITTHGFFLGSVMRELYQSNRRCSMNERTGEGTPGGFSCGTLHDCAAKSRFKEVMCCGCSSCLFCLSEGGKLSRDSEWPEDCWHEPAFDFEYIYDY